MEENKQAYNSEKVVSFYNNQIGLQKPEEAIITIFKNDFKSMKMLDIGVGAGRTSHFFSTLVNEYIGVDYSEKMIESCNKTFSNNKKAKFLLADVRNLTDFSDNEFDFIIFSFNGIDCISFEDRKTALREINRVLKPNGHFFFSTHNILYLNEFLKIKLHLNLLYSVKRFFDLRKIKKINKQQLENKDTSDWIIINDGDNNFSCQYFYTRPSFQIQQLKEHGFDTTYVFSIDDGKILETENEILNNKDKWVSFLCKKLSN